MPGALIRAGREIKKAAIGSRYIWAATYSRERQHVLMGGSMFSWAAAGMCGKRVERGTFNFYPAPILTACLYSHTARPIEPIFLSLSKPSDEERLEVMTIPSCHPVVRGGHCPSCSGLIQHYPYSASHTSSRRVVQRACTVCSRRT